MAKNITATIPATDETDETTVVVEAPEKADTEEAPEEQKPETDKAEEALITPYKAAQIIEAELGLTVPPQMVYTYVKNGAFGEEAKTSKRVTARAAIEWGQALKDRRAAKETKKTADAKKDRGEPVEATVTEVE